MSFVSAFLLLSLLSLLFALFNNINNNNFHNNNINNNGIIEESYVVSHQMKSHYHNHNYHNYHNYHVILRDHNQQDIELLEYINIVINSHNHHNNTNNNDNYRYNGNNYDDETSNNGSGGDYDKIVLTVSMCDELDLLCDFDIWFQKPAIKDRHCLVHPNYIESSSIPTSSSIESSSSTSILSSIPSSYLSSSTTVIKLTESKQFLHQFLQSKDLSSRVESVLEFINEQSNLFLSYDGSTSTIASWIKFRQQNLYSVSPTHPSHQCRHITYQEFVSMPWKFIEFWTRQEPVIIDNIPTSRHDSLANHLLLLKGHRLGVKLSPTAEFEGIDKLLNWGMAGTQYVPREVLDQMQSPDLVVVRAAHKELNISQLFQIFGHGVKQRKLSPKDPLQPSTDATTASLNAIQNDINAYVEYLPINNFKTSSAMALRTLLDRLLPGDSIATNDTSTTRKKSTDSSSLSLSLPSWIEDFMLEGKAHLWIGDGRAVGKLHFDPFDNILVQVEGSKTFLLADPSSNERFYEGHMREAELEVSLNITSTDIKASFLKNKLSESTSMVHSPVATLKHAYLRSHSLTDNKEWSETVARYGLAKNIENKVLSCEVRAGSALFVPSFWWHEVQSFPGDPISVFSSDLICKRDQSRGDDTSSCTNTSFPVNVAVNFWFDPLWDKEFPCADCRRKFNKHYRHVIKALFRRYENYVNWRG